MHVDMDEVLTREVGAGRRNHTLRFWEWESPLVVIGSFQSMRNEVDSDAVRRHGVSVVRRISGGGAMFMEHGNAITYSLYVPQSLVDEAVDGALHSAEISAAQVLVEEKFGTEDWLYRVP